MSDSRLLRFVAPNRAGLIAHVVATLALIVAAVAVVFAVMPYTVDGVVRCSAALGGSKLVGSIPATSNFFGQGGNICHSSGSNRLVTELVVFILALAAGVGGWVLPLGLPWWLGGAGGPKPRKP